MSCDVLAYMQSLSNSSRRLSQPSSAVCTQYARCYSLHTVRTLMLSVHSVYNVSEWVGE